jgi:hypothetical protein
MAEKILGLLSAFVLGGVAAFFYLTWCFKFMVQHMPETRRKMRELIERYEPQRVALDFPLSPGRVAATREAHGWSVECGMRAISGRCIQCGSPEDVRPEGDVLFPQPLCRPCAGKFWGIQ